MLKHTRQCSTRKYQLNSLTRKNIKRWCFIHIPKCGGTSFSNAIMKSYGWRYYVQPQCFFQLNPKASVKSSSIVGEPLLKHRLDIASYALSNTNFGHRSYIYAGGHFPCSEKMLNQFKGKWSFVVLLRDPIKRYISHFSYNKHKKNNHFKNDESIVSYLKSDDGKAVGGLTIQYLTACPPSEVRERKWIELAKKNLLDFAVVGQLENLDDFEQRLSNLGMNIKVKHKNKNQRCEFFSDEIMELINKVTAPDQELYDFATSLIKNSN